MSRRTFLRTLETHGAVSVCCSALGASTATLLLASCGGLRYAPSSLENRQLIVARPDIVAAGVLLDGPDGQPPLFLRAIDAERFRALSLRCMHRGCQVDPVDERFVCPCHGSEYHTDGTVLKGPTELPLVQYRVTSDDRRVFVHLDAPLARERE